jgi:hypothetical protein
MGRITQKEKHLEDLNKKLLAQTKAREELAKRVASSSWSQPKSGHGSISADPSPTVKTMDSMLSAPSTHDLNVIEEDDESEGDTSSRPTDRNQLVMNQSDDHRSSLKLELTTAESNFYAIPSLGSEELRSKRSSQSDSPRQSPRVSLSPRDSTPIRFGIDSLRQLHHQFHSLVRRVSSLLSVFCLFFTAT